MEEKYKEVSLNKIKLIPVNPELKFKALTQEKHKVYAYETITVGLFYYLEEAKDALLNYSDTEPEVIAYEIIGPEHGSGDPDLDFDWDNLENDEPDVELNYDESPEFQLLYNRNKDLMMSYFYDNENPGGERLKGENSFNKGEMAYVRQSIFMGDNHYDLLIPVEIVSKITPEYLKNKWSKVIKEQNKLNHGENSVEPSEECIQSKIDSLLNIEKDSFIFKPLVTVKCNWGEEPNVPFDDAARMDFIFKNFLK